MELVEGEVREDHSIIFKKVGPELRVVEGGFCSIPSQALAISNKFGLTFFLHSQGFCIARTHDLVQASRKLVDSKDKYNAKDNALACIHLPSVQSLVLSQDELIIAACTEDSIQFYNVPALVEGKGGSQEDTALLKSLPILDEKPGVKVLAWNLAQRDVILVLSKGGKLTTGPFAEQDRKKVANEVEAADWSPDGEYICYITSDKNLHICNADLSSRSSWELPREMLSDAVNGGSEVCVDVLKWARCDSILISCVHSGSDGEEDNSRIFVLVSSQGHFAKLQDQSKAKILSFEGFFTSIDTSILPPDTGPYTLSNYVPPWELLIVTSRRSIDDHIGLLGWFQEGGKYEVQKFDLLDMFMPRIELQACGDYNCVVGLAVDTTTISIEIPAPNGDSGEKLRPGPVLICMTLEGNLSLSSIARTDSTGIDVEVINSLLELPKANEVLLSHGLTRKNKATGTEDLDKKSMFSKTMSQETNNEQIQETVTRETNTENFLLTPAAVFVAGGGTKLEKRKELSIEGFQAQTGVPLKQKEAPLAVEMTEETNSEQLQKASVAVLEAGNSQKLEPPEKWKDMSKESLQPGIGVPLKQKEAPVLLEQRNKSLFPTEKKVTSAPALSEMESEFIRELDEVKGMAMQIDNLMALIEGKRKEKGGEPKPFFTKLSVEDIESKTRNLFRECQSFREQLKEQGRSINDLGDESLQVDYGRVYVESILEQAFDVRYQELWNKQTLPPEVAALRKRIIQADQSLKQQIAELEEHLHNLELSQWHKKHHSKHSTISSSRFEDKKFRFMQSLYDTVNTQMVIAQQLADRLTAQMEVLKLPVIPSENIESSIDISRLKLQDMVLQEESAGDFSSRTGSRPNSFRPSDFSPIRTASKGSLQIPSKVMAATGTRPSLQDSTRRRRDSVDKLWVDVGAAKTTVKRAAPAKRFGGISFSPNKGVLEADDKQLKHARSVMTSSSSFNPVQLAERPKQTRIDILGGEASLRAEDNRKTDVWKVQTMPQGSTQVTAPASITNSVSRPSTALATTAHTADVYASKETSFSRTGLGRTVTQNVSITNVEKLQALASRPSLSTESVPQNRSEPQSGTFSLSQVTQMGLPRIETTARNTLELRARPVETDVEVGKMDPSKKALFPFTSQGKVSTAANSFFPAPSSSDLQGKEALNVLQSKATVVQHQGALTKSEDLKVGKPVIQSSSNTPVGMRSHEIVPLTAGMTCAASNVVSSADQQGQTINDTKEPETGIIDEANTNANLAKSCNVSIAGYTNKTLPGFVEDIREQKVSSPLSMVRSLSPEDLAIGPVSTVQAQSDFVSAITSSASSLAMEPADQPLGSLSSVTASSLFQYPNVMSTMSTVEEVPTSSEAVTSSLFNLSSVSSVKPTNFFDKGVITGEQYSSPSTVSVSTSSVSSTLQGPPPVSDEEDMEEVGNNINDFESSSFAGFGLGSSSSSAVSQHSSPFGGTSNWNQSSPPTSLSVPAGQLFKPASFSIPAPQLTSQTTSLFGNNLTTGAGGPFANASSGFGQPTAAFGQPAQSGSSGQQALGNALGTFGQTRQIGSPFGVSSPSGFGIATSGGFASAGTGGGFANAATSGGFAGVTSGGGFAGVAGGGGFASAATGSGFAGFAGGSISGSPNPNPSGFGVYSGGLSAFGGNTNSSLFTQMRK